MPCTASRTPSRRRATSSSSTRSRPRTPLYSTRTRPQLLPSRQPHLKPHLQPHLQPHLKRHLQRPPRERKKSQGPGNRGFEMMVEMLDKTSAVSDTIFCY